MSAVFSKTLPPLVFTVQVKSAVPVLPAECGSP
ncbi:hypothetical protein SANTM175S_00652 [Streptomyces antimycoticus]